MLNYHDGENTWWTLILKGYKKNPLYLVNDVIKASVIDKLCQWKTQIESDSIET